MASAKTNEKASIEPPLLKVARAREHIDDLEEASRQYVEDPSTFEVLGEPDPMDVHRMIGTIRLATQPPARLALICGDAVHNLRSALDYLVWQLGIADSGEVSDQSAFPFVPKANEGNWESIAKVRLGLLNATHVEEIRRLQMYVDESDNSPNVMLGMVGAMDNRDKHRLPLVVATAVTRGRLELGAPVNQLEFQALNNGPVQVGSEPVALFRLKAWGPNELPVKALVSLGIAFGHPQGPTPFNLRGAADVVSGVIGSFAADIAAPRGGSAAAA
jgi:hypothetical protein